MTKIQKARQALEQLRREPNQSIVHAEDLEILAAYVQESEKVVLAAIDLWFAKTRSVFKGLKLAKLDEESISHHNPLNDSLFGLTTPV